MSRSFLFFVTIKTHKEDKASLFLSQTNLDSDCMSMSTANHRLTKSTSHRNHRATAALDTSNPYYKITSPTRGVRPKTESIPRFKSTNCLSQKQQKRNIDEITNNILKNQCHTASTSRPPFASCLDSFDILERARSCYFDIPFVNWFCFMYVNSSSIRGSLVSSGWFLLVHS